MPQLDHATFASQIFWLFIIFYAFYFISLKYVLPTLAEILKVRQEKLRLSTAGADNLKSEEVALTEEHSKLVENSMKVAREILTNYIQSSSEWMSKQVRTLNEVELGSLNKIYITSLTTLSARKELIKQLIRNN